MLGMVTFGFGELVGSFLLGYIIDKFGNKTSASSNFVIMLLMFGVTFLFTYTQKFGILAHLMCLFWGIQDGGVNTYVTELVGFEFDSVDEPFAVYNLLQGMGAFVFQLTQSKLSGTMESYIIYTWILLVVAISAIFSTFFFNFKDSHNNTDVKT